MDALDTRLDEVADAWAAVERPAALLEESERSGRAIAPAGLERAAHGSAPGTWTHVMTYMGYYAQGNELRVRWSMPCWDASVKEARVRESDSVVVVAVLLGPASQPAAPSAGTPTAGAGALGCSGASRNGTASLTLAEPLGDRIVVDAATGAGVFASSEPIY